MRILTLFFCLFGLLNASGVLAASPNAEFVKETPLLRGAQKLLASDGEHLYFEFRSGVNSTLAVTDLNGKLLHTLPTKKTKGLTFKKPESVAVEAGIVYVADSKLNKILMFSSAGRFIGDFGASKSGFFDGSAEHELNKPLALAIYEGLVYVLDNGSKRVLMFGSNGVYMGALGIKPSANATLKKTQGEAYKLHDPIDMKIDIAGRIYILDAEDLLVKVYSPHGELLHSLPDDGGLLAFAVAPDGVYVAKSSDFSIRKYDFNNKLMYRFGMNGAGTGQFRAVSGMVALKDQQVLIADARKDVLNYFRVDEGLSVEVIPKSASRTFVKSGKVFPLLVKKLAWNGKHTIYGVDAAKKVLVLIRNGKIKGRIKIKGVVPVAVAFDNARAAWMLDKNNRVLKLNSAGKVVFSFGSKGSGDGQFEEPTDLVISPSGKIYVSDQENDSVQVFNAGGKFLSAVHKLDQPVAITVDSDENLYVIDKKHAYVSVYSAKGVLEGKLGDMKEGVSGSLSKPQAVLAMLGEVMVLDGDSVKVYSHKGTFLRSFGGKGKGAGELNEPVAMARKDAVTFAIAEEGNKRIQTFVTYYKPSAPQNLVAQSGLHSIELSWDALALPYIKQYQVYSSKDEHVGFVRVASVAENHFVDRGLEADGKYFYRVAAETRQAYEGATSSAVSGVSKIYTPPVLDSVQLDVSAWQVKMSWKPIESEFVNSYYIYQKNKGEFTKIGEAITSEFTIDKLTPNTQYTYYVAAHSSDGTDAEKFEVVANTLAFSKAPLEIEVLQLRPIFSNTYKLYQDDGLGVVKLTNNTNNVMEGVTFSFKVNEFMDFSTESKLEKLQPGQSAEIKLKAVFNNHILNVTEDTSVQTKLEASYFDNGKQMSYSKSLTVSVYEKHKLMWDERERYASFITPKDTPVISFVRSVITQYPDTKDKSQLAALLFNALGAYGLTYIPDPTNPYQVTSGKTDTVDYIQFPRETLEHKSGDCDDLVAFYISALESVGFETRVIEVPGHMFMMFSTDVSATDDGYTMDDMYVVFEGKLWIPVETTVLGSSFIKAWELGASNYYKWQGKGLTLLNIQQAWETYKPASLPNAKWRPGVVKKEDIHKKFPSEFSAMLKISSQTQTRFYRQIIAKKPSDVDAHLQVGIALAKLGDRPEAMKYFDKVLTLQPNNAAALNNRGNLFMIDNKYADAQKAYRAATKISADDPYVWINLAKASKAVRKIKEAKAAFRKAQSLDSSVKKKYKALGLELSGTL